MGSPTFRQSPLIRLPGEIYAGAVTAVDYFLDASPAQPRRNALGPWAVAAVVFFNVAGSPVGIEDAVVAGGPLYAIIGLVVMPFVWCIPEALVAAELATAFPEDAGFIAWVSEAFGETAGYVEGIMSWVAGVVDNAAYPVLIARYTASMLVAGDQEKSKHEKSLCVAIIVLLTSINYCGLKIVGNLLIGLSAFCLLPFILMLMMGAHEIEPQRWWDHEPLETVQWGLLINTLFWNLNYFDSVATLAAEVHNPAKTFPKAMRIVTPLVIVMYLSAVMLGVGVSPQGAVWHASYFAEVAFLIGGRWLQAFVVAGTVASCVGQFEAETSENAFSLLGMAERRMLPAVFATRSRFGTPSVGILSGMAVTILCVQMEDLSDIIELLNVVYVYAALLEFSAFLHLRFKFPQLVRPFRAPVSNIGAVFMLIPTFIFTVLVLVLSSWRAQIIAIGVMVFSLILAFAMRWLRDSYPDLFLKVSKGTVDLSSKPAIAERDTASTISCISVSPFVDGLETFV
eukprot:m.188801 g.188801  ORF g.188801 m.188801 type:complete len:511 (-) comp24837_c0_seq2:2043-3575(-)